MSRVWGSPRIAFALRSLPCCVLLKELQLVDYTQIYIYICPAAFIYLILNANRLSIMWGPYLVQTALVCFSSKSHYLVQTTLVSSSKSISFLWGPYLVHKRILMIDKQIEHAVDYFSNWSPNKSGCPADDSDCTVPHLTMWCGMVGGGDVACGDAMCGALVCGEALHHDFVFS